MDIYIEPNKVIITERSIEELREDLVKNITLASDTMLREHNNRQDLKVKEYYGQGTTCGVFKEKDSRD